MRELRVKIKAETGLHARTASLLVNAVSKSKSNITVEKEGQEANLKSLLGLLGLGVLENDEIVIRASGRDENEVIEALIACGKAHNLW